MKQWMSRFALLAVLGSLLCSTLVMGCGGGDDTDTVNVNNVSNNAAPPPPPPAP